MKRPMLLKTLGMRVLLVLALAVVSVLNLSCGQSFPFSFTVSIPMGTYDLRSMDIFSQILAGTEIPEDFEMPALPLCNLPTEDEIRALVSESAGDWVANLLDIDEMNLVNTRLTASVGDFDSLTRIALQWNPKALGGIEQPSVDLGTAENAEGLGTEVALIPGEPVDFLELIDEDAANPAEGCPSLQADIEGVVPATLPAWNVTVEVEVIGTVQF